jgi:hypothetical protein
MYYLFNTYDSPKRTTLPPPSKSSSLYSNISRSKEGLAWTNQQTQNGIETNTVIPRSPNIKPTYTYDVIIIGSGFMGLIATRNLSQRPNIRVLLIEVRDRNGGHMDCQNI